jgi:hypothetical protein
LDGLKLVCLYHEQESHDIPVLFIVVPTLPRNARVEVQLHYQDSHKPLLKPFKMLTTNEVPKDSSISQDDDDDDDDDDHNGYSRLSNKASFISCMFSVSYHYGLFIF